MKDGMSLGFLCTCLKQIKLVDKWVDVQMLASLSRAEITISEEGRETL